MQKPVEFSPAHSVIEQARSVWGDRMAHDVMGNVIDSINFANEVIAPPALVDGLKIQIADIPSHHPNGVEAPRLGGMHTNWAGFCLLMDEKAPEEVYRLTKEVVTSETVRVRIFQERLRRKFYVNNDERSELDACIEDGMMICTAEDVLTPEESVTLPEFSSKGTDPALIYDGIKKRLALEGRTLGKKPLNDLRMGTPEFSRPGYKIGHAIVRSALTTHSLSFDEMLTLPPAFFSDHARKMLETSVY